MSKNARNRSKLLEIARIVSLASARTQILSSSAGYGSLWVALYGIVTSYLCNIFDPCESRNLSVHSWDSNAPKITGISDDYPSQYTTQSQTGTAPGAARSAPGRLRVAFETHTRLPLHAPTALLPLMLQSTCCAATWESRRALPCQPAPMELCCSAALLRPPLLQCHGCLLLHGRCSRRCARARLRRRVDHRSRRQASI